MNDFRLAYLGGQEVFILVSGPWYDELEKRRWYDEPIKISYRVAIAQYPFDDEIIFHRTQTAYWYPIVRPGTTERAYYFEDGYIPRGLDNPIYDNKEMQRIRLEAGVTNQAMEEEYEDERWERV